MTEREIADLVTAMPDAAVLTASEENGAPESAWGDMFFYCGPDRRMPFATLVRSDYPGHDERSALGRPGVYRLNIGVGRETFQRLLGFAPSAVPNDLDYTALDRLIPHPVYAPQSWLSVLNPGPATSAQARELLAGAHARARERHRP